MKQHPALKRFGKHQNGILCYYNQCFAWATREEAELGWKKRVVQGQAPLAFPKIQRGNALQELQKCAKMQKKIALFCFQMALGTCILGLSGCWKQILVKIIFHIYGEITLLLPRTQFWAFGLFLSIWQFWAFRSIFKALFWLVVVPFVPPLIDLMTPSLLLLL